MSSHPVPIPAPASDDPERPLEVSGSDQPGADTPGSDTPGSDTPGSDQPHIDAQARPLEASWSDRHTPMAALKARLAAFVAERDWGRFHRPKDLAMAVSVEAGELLELFLWVGSDEPGGRPSPDRTRLEAEVADVAICLLNLCNQTGIDLAAAIARKLEHNAAKYPVSHAHGSALKYDEYPTDVSTS